MKAALPVSAALSSSSGEVRIRLVEDVKGLGKAGQSVLMTLSPSDVTVSEEMDTFMVGYAPPGFRADEAAPIQLVGKDTGSYRIFGLNNAFRPVNVLSSFQADIPEVDPEATLGTYQVQERALGGFIPTVTQLNFDEGNNGGFDPHIALLRRVNWALSLDRELRVFGATGVYRTVANWAANNRATIAAGAEWNDTVNGDPMLDLFDRIEASAQAVTGIFINPPVAHALLRSQSVKDHMKMLIGDSANSAQVAAATATMANMDFQIPGLPPFHIVSSKVLNETSGALEFILDDTVILVSNPPGAGSSGEDIMTAKTFRRRGPSGTGFTTREFQLERRGLHGGVFVASGHAEDVRMIASNVGGLILDVLQ
jgi:hypothetical protein